MTDRKISELPAATLPLAGTEPTVVVQGGETRRAPVNSIKGLPGGVASGAWMSPMGHGSNTAIESQPAGQIQATAFAVQVAMTVDRVSFRSAATVNGTNLVAFALYRADPLTLLPTGDPVWASGSLSNAVANTIIEVAVATPFALAPGVYWFMHNQNEAGGFVNAQDPATRRAIAAGLVPAPFASFLGFGEGGALRRTQTFGTWPTLAGAMTGWTTNINRSIAYFIMRNQ